MPDKLQEFYEAWKKTVDDPVEFQAFQGGFSAAAANMRERAMALVDKIKDHNELKNAIGSLSDIP